MGTFAEELYSETLKLVDVKLDSSSTVSIDEAHLNGNLRFSDVQIISLSGVVFSVFMFRVNCVCFLFVRFHLND